MTPRLVPTLLTVVVFLVVLWPTRQSGARLLRTWGIAEPRASQTEEAVRYLRQRRILYVARFLALPPLVGLTPPAGVRVASLDPRTWRDLLPRWAIGLGVGLTAVTTGMAGYAVGFGPYPGDAWVVLGAVVLCVAVVTGLIHLAVRRPSSADQEVDAALRTRTARVAVAVGFGWLAVLAGRAQTTLAGMHSPLSEEWLGVTEAAMTVVLFGSIVAWILLAVPTRRSLARTR